MIFTLILRIFEGLHLAISLCFSYSNSVPTVAIMLDSMGGLISVITSFISSRLIIALFTVGGCVHVMQIPNSMLCVLLLCLMLIYLVIRLQVGVF